MINLLRHLIPHAHRWHQITISHPGVLNPAGRYCLATCITARCRGCGARLHKLYYHDLSDSEARRWLG
ncbi:hypothetical protein [Pantoea sp. UBA4549]|uniref:hypothetical protein n=1 Tax=Pantoea sp. UBA4549 TaxID=1947033 RepID=UPI0026010B82|nr:hypothetical protein [Pantoea sp. UBA4549]